MTNSENGREGGSPLPSFEAEVGSRLRLVESEFRNREEAAKTAGVAKSTFQRWVEGKADPSFRGLARLAAATGVSLNWLATGEGPMRFDQAAAGTSMAAPVIDTKLMGRIAEGVVSVYKAENAGLPPQFLGQRVGQIYAALVIAHADPEDRLIALGQALEQLRQELRAPRTAGSAKHSA